MIKVKDGYAKLIGTTYLGSADRVLLSNGGDKAISDFAAASALSNYVTLATAQTITGVKTFAHDTFILAGAEHNDIKHSTQWTYNWGGYGMNNTTPHYTGMYNSLDFYWYNDIWSIGNLRGMGLDSSGFGIGLKKRDTDGKLYFAPALRITETESYINNNKIWHTGNDGSGSGLDADLLDGVHLAGHGGRLGVMRSWKHGTFTTVNLYFGNGNVVVIDPKPTDDSTLSNNTIIFSLGDSNTRNTQLAFFYEKDLIKYRRAVDGPTWQPWRTLAFTDSNITGNAATASLLRSNNTTSIPTGLLFYSGWIPQGNTNNRSWCSPTGNQTYNSVKGEWGNIIRVNYDSTHYNELFFDGNNTRPSWRNIIGTNSTGWKTLGFQEDIRPSGYVTSGTAGLSSYWGKLWEHTRTDNYSDVDITFYIHSAYNLKRGFIHIRVRREPITTDEVTTYRHSISMVLISGNIPTSEVRLYHDATIGKMELWVDVVGQYGVYNATIISCTTKNSKETFPILGTLYNNIFKTALTLPTYSYITLSNLNSSQIHVQQHTTNNTEYPLVWSDLNNTNNVKADLLYKSYSHLTYNPNKRRITVASVHSGGVLYLNGASGVHLKYNNADEASLVLDRNWFKPFEAANGKLDLGLSSARWKGLYALTGNFSGDVVATKFIGDLLGNADTVDGYHSDDFIKSLIDPNGKDDYLDYRNRALFKTAFIRKQGDFGSLIIPTWPGNSPNNYYLSELRFRNEDHPQFRYSHNGVVTMDWQTIAFTSDNVASATKLQTARTIWGQSFDGTGDVSGDISLGSGVIRSNNGQGMLSSNGYVLIGYETSANGNRTYIDGNDIYLRYGTTHANGLVMNSSGNVGIGTTNPEYKLDVNGSIRASTDLGVRGFAQINGNAYLMGNVGIGTTNPEYKLDVNGAVRVGHNVANGVLLKFNMDRAWHFYQEGSGSTSALVLQSGTSGKYFHIKNDSGSNIASFFASSESGNRVGVNGVFEATTIYQNGTSLDSLLNAKLNSSSYTASDVLAKLKTVDGSGSGLDADLLDGKHNGELTAKYLIFSSTNITTSPDAGSIAYSRMQADYVGNLPKSNNANGVITINTHSGNFHHLLGFTGSGMFYRNMTGKALDETTAWNTILHSGNYSSYLGYIGTTPVQASSAALALTGITNITMTGNLSTSGNILATTFIGDLLGNAATASKLNNLSTVYNKLYYNSKSVTMSTTLTVWYIKIVLYAYAQPCLFMIGGSYNNQKDRAIIETSGMSQGYILRNCNLNGGNITGVWHQSNYDSTEKKWIFWVRLKGIDNSSSHYSPSSSATYTVYMGENDSAFTVTATTTAPSGAGWTTVGEGDNSIIIKNGTLYGTTTTAITANNVVVNNSDSNSTYRMVWHNGNSLYSTAGVYCNPSTDCLYASHYYETSDITFKTNIKPISNSDNIPILKSFDWKSDGSHSYGLIALELEDMGYPELVSEGDGYKTVNYSAALSLIVGKLQVKIKELEKEIENLKNKN